ncbi:Putative zinc-finger [Nocardiopsis flavescens]|uniref:Putative zinc-finger n=3 Tax=Nocardiopsis flavescens TaxID=758803 RepID=A0A1M6UDU7_9ACTN|nr:zf-HC2 domain-containing protein [Nocardiopsis flavescens]SHK67415.1 Putative zinc-finger [Nocardiopsis flavescens]
MTSPAEGGADPYRDWDGAYVLGALEPGERREFERHLLVCGPCRGAVAELAGMPGLLGAVPAQEALAMDAAAGAEAASGPGAVPLASVAAAARRRRARGRALLAAVAACAVLAAGAGGWAAGRGTAAPAAPVAQAPDPQVPQTVELSPVGEVELWASVTVTPTAWGTRFDWTCDYPASGGDEDIVYTLVLVDDEGARSTAATWSWSESGAPSGLGASTALPLDRIDGVEIGLAGTEGALASGRV